MGLTGPNEAALNEDSERNENEDIKEHKDNHSIDSDNTDYNSEQDDEDEDEDASKDERFTEGETLTFIRVRFPGNAKSQAFLLGKRSFIYGQKVLAMSDRGMTVGYINSFPYDRPFTKSMLPLRTISKLATQEEIEKQNSFIKKEREGATICNRLIEKYRLDMNLTHVEFMQFGKKVVFYFNAPARVDFRDLVKELVGELKMRVELRQISVRDRTAALGAIGVCGLQTCCSSFLKNYGHVSIKMAKNQNLALIPSKINGVCGQIKCCIKYEDDVYSDKRSLLPREGSYIETKNGDRGRVDRLHIFIEQFEMLTDSGIRRKYARSQYDSRLKLPNEWKFPERFDHVTNETSTIIGLDEEEKLKALRYQQMWEEQDDEDDDEDNGSDDQVDEDGEDQNDSDDDSNEDDDQESPSQDSDQQESSESSQYSTEADQKNEQRSNNNRQRSGRGSQSAQASNQSNQGDQNSQDEGNSQRPRRNRRRRGPRNKKPGGDNQGNNGGQNRSE